MLNILIVDDEIQNRDALSEVLRRLGHQVTSAQDGKEALEKTLEQKFDLILSDIRMPHMDGVEFFEAYNQLNSSPHDKAQFAFMTAYGRMEEAVDLLRKGALHFITKPVRKKDILHLIDELQAKRQKYVQPSPEAQTEIIYRSRAFQEVIDLVDKVAPTLASVLLVGESGTGKELLARRVHERSDRSKNPFVAFHAGAMPETLMESELFGHEKGAFTGADQPRVGQIRSAEKGSFFMDELSTMPWNVQTKLLRVIQERSVLPLGSTQPVQCDVRWISATNQKLEPMVERGEFREDLLYRLKVVVVNIPPLRERQEDIEVLIQHFLEEMALRDKKEKMVILSETLNALIQYPWPGNVRELRNVIERATVLSTGREFTLDLLPEHIQQTQKAREIRLSIGMSLKTVEDQFIEETLKICGGDKNRAASMLGIAPRTLYRWVEKRTTRE